MDAPDADAEVQLHKASAELVAELDSSLRGLVRARSAARAREALQATTTVGLPAARSAAREPFR